MFTPGGRIPREVNPVAGERPKPLPSHKHRTNETYHPVTGLDGGMDTHVISSALPTGASTAANQATIITHIDTLEARLGDTTDAEATGNGSINAIMKRVRTLIGDALVTLGSAIGARATLVAGSDGTNARAIRTGIDGTLVMQGVMATTAVEGEKTATGTAVAQFVGGSALANRSRVLIHNPLSATTPLRAGVSTVVIDEILPGEVYVYPVIGATSIFVRTELGTNQVFRIREW